MSSELMVGDAKLVPWQAQPGVSIWVLLDQSTGCNRTEMTMVEFAEGRVGGEHAHDADQVMYTLEGELTIEVGKESYRVPKGSAISVPQGLRHLHKNTGKGVMRGLAIYVPPVGVNLGQPYAGER